MHPDYTMNRIPTTFEPDIVACVVASDELASVGATPVSIRVDEIQLAVGLLDDVEALETEEDDVAVGVAADDRDGAAGI